MTLSGEYFCGNKISEYGIKNGFLDYGTLSKAFDAVLNNSIYNAVENMGFFWDQESGMIDNSDEIEELKDKNNELEEKLEELEEKLDNLEPCKDNPIYANKINDIRALMSEAKAQIEENEGKIEDLEDEQERTPEIFQYYIVDNSGAELLEELNEIVFYCSDLDMYLWGVTHFGTAWDYVLTDVPCNCEKEA